MEGLKEKRDKRGGVKGAWLRRRVEKEQGRTAEQTSTEKDEGQFQLKDRRRTRIRNRKEFCQNIPYSYDGSDSTANGRNMNLKSIYMIYLHEYIYTN